MRMKIGLCAALLSMGLSVSLCAEDEEVLPFEKYTIETNQEEEHTFLLSDGSCWLPREKDEPKVFSWKKGVPIAFTVNEGWISGEDYVFTNEETSESIKAELIAPPKDYVGKARWIAYIDDDMYAGSLFLDNGAKFSLYPDDWERFKNWKEDDFVLVGTYIAYFSPYKHLLYNFRTKDWIFVKLRDK